MISSSDKLRLVHSDIRGALYQEALRMEANGEKVLKLNTGNPGRFGFKLPGSVKTAIQDHIEEAVPYCDVRGMTEARQTICAYHQGRGIRDITADDVFIGNGVSEMASMLINALIGTDDEIMLPAPCYSLWSNSVYLSGGKAVFYRCDPKNEWNPQTDDIRAKITPKTKAILLINPNNPTGAVYSHDVLMEIADIARRNHLILISDEIYDRLVMDGLAHESVAALAPDVPTVTLNGLSKSHIICGFRCGWMVFSGGEKNCWNEVKDGVMKLASMRLCGNALTQLVIPAAMADQESTREIVVTGGRLCEQRNATMEVLRQIEGISFVPCRAAFYLFPSLDEQMYRFENANDFAMRFLHEKKILVIPGNGFEWFEDLRFRIVMLPRPEQLHSAMESLGEFLYAYRK